MVFQGCFTGGFISDTNDPLKNPSDLAKLSHITLLTASRSDRASFGCDAGSTTTVYGKAFARGIQIRPWTYADIEWSVVSAASGAFVEGVEDRLHIKDGSEPQYFHRP